MAQHQTCSKTERKLNGCGGVEASNVTAHISTRELFDRQCDRPNFCDYGPLRGCRNLVPATNARRTHTIRMGRGLILTMPFFGIVALSAHSSYVILGRYRMHAVYCMKAGGFGVRYIFINESFSPDALLRVWVKYSMLRTSWSCE